MLKRLVEFLLPDQRSPRVCEACGEAFVCGASVKGCWCVSVKLDAPTRAALRTRLNDCLCRACLESFAKPAKEGEADEW